MIDTIAGFIAILSLGMVAINIYLINSSRDWQANGDYAAMIVMWFVLFMGASMTWIIFKLFAL